MTVKEIIRLLEEFPTGEDGHIEDIMHELENGLHKTDHAPDHPMRTHIGKAMKAVVEAYNEAVKRSA